MRSPLVALLALGLASATPRVAEARHSFFRVGGLRVGGAMHVRGAWAGPRVHVGGSVHAHWVAPPPQYAYFAEPPPPPSAYPCGYCGAPAPAPAPIALAATPPPPPRWGAGVYFSGSQTSEGPEGEGVGVLLRFRGARTELELELAEERFPYTTTNRRDRRLGAALLVPLTHGTFAPYLLAGAGMIGVLETGRDRELGYVAGGGGLAFRLSPRITLSAEMRWSARRRLGEHHDAVPLEDMPVARSTETSATLPYSDPTLDRETAVEGRISGVLYF